MQMRTTACCTALILLVGSAAWAADGAVVYRSQCAACHGETGKSETPVGKAMKLPALAGSVSIAAMPDAEIAARIKDVAKHPAKTKELPDAELAAVAAHVKKLALDK